MSFLALPQGHHDHEKFGIKLGHKASYDRPTKDTPEREFPEQLASELGKTARMGMFEVRRNMLREINANAFLL